MASETPQKKADIGRVLSRGFAALGANFLPFFAASVLLAGVPAFLTQYVMIRGVGAAAQIVDPAMLLSPAFWAPFVGALFASMLAGMLLQGALVRATVLQLSGRDPEVGASALLALRLLLPLIGLSLVLVVLICIGVLLLIVPAVMIYCATIVAVPALVVERRGVFASIGRSRELTRGSRWRVFLLALLFLVLGGMVQQIVNQATGVASNPMADPNVLRDPIMAGVAGAISASLTGMVVAVLLAALYVELREGKEGTSADELADIFR
jgi:hypothetical protein